MGRKNFNNSDIESLIDDELDDETAVRLRDHLEDDEEARAFYNKIVRQKALLQLWWKNFKSN